MILIHSDGPVNKHEHDTHLHDGRSRLLRGHVKEPFLRLAKFGSLFVVLFLVLLHASDMTLAKLLQRSHDLIVRSIQLFGKRGSGEWSERESDK